MRSRSILLLLAFVLLGSAMTGRTAAQTPDATPGASPVTTDATWQIAGTQEIDVDSQFAALSPDGQWLASFSTDRGFCVRDIETLTPTCVEEQLFIREETITWTPDSTAVAFAFNAIRYLEESDIYVYELETGTLTNLTDDGVEGSMLDALDDDPPIDDVPTWSPDSQRIAFARSYTSDERSSTSIMQIDRSGGEPVEVVQLEVEQPMTVWMPMYWLPDGSLLYSQISSDLDDPRNGVWKVGVDDGSSPLQVVSGDEEGGIPGPMVMDVDAEQGSAIDYSYLLAGQSAGEVDQPLTWIVDLESGTMAPLIASDAGRVIAAGYSPDGETIMLAMVSDGEWSLALLDVASGEATPIDLGGTEVLARDGTIQWAENDTVLLQRPMGPLLITLEPAA